MNFLVYISAAVMVTFVSCQVSLPPGYKEKYPNYYKFSKKARPVRDVTWDDNAGNGKMLGSLGNSHQGDSVRSKLAGQTYENRVLGPNKEIIDINSRLESKKVSNTAMDGKKNGKGISKRI